MAVEDLKRTGPKGMRSRPICGTISLALPLAVGGIVYVVIRTLPDGDSGTLGTVILAIYSLVASVLGGFILAIIGLVRRERWWLLPCAALALNLGALAFLIKEIT